MQSKASHLRQLSFGSRCAMYQNAWTEQKMASCGWNVTTFVVTKMKAMITFQHELSCAARCFILVLQLLHLILHLLLSLCVSVFLICVNVDCNLIMFT
jgi:hypothetical protein